MDNKEWLKKLQQGIERLRQGNEMLLMLDPVIDEADGASMEATYRYRPSAWMMNEFGIISGAAAAAMLDISSSISAQAIIGDNLTLDMNTSYLRKLSAEKDVKVRVTVVKAGRLILRMRGELFDGATGKLAVKAELNIMSAE